MLLLPPRPLRAAALQDSLEELPAGLVDKQKRAPYPLLPLPREARHQAEVEHPLREPQHPALHLLLTTRAEGVAQLQEGEAVAAAGGPVRPLLLADRLPPLPLEHRLPPPAAPLPPLRPLLEHQLGVQAVRGLNEPFAAHVAAQRPDVGLLQLREEHHAPLPEVLPQLTVGAP